MPRSKTAVCIRMAMEKGDISAKFLAQSIGVANSTVSRWRKDGCDSMFLLRKIANICDMSLDEMMELAE